MSVNIGITGLPGSGRTTIFNGLTRGKADIAAATQHIGVVKVPEPRLDRLAELLHPGKIVPAEVKYVDIGAGTRSPKDRGIGGELLVELSKADALINVVRVFEDETVPHIEGSVNAERDMAVTDLELAFSDIAIIERRLARIEESLKGARAPERQNMARETETLQRLKAALEKEIPLRQMELSPEELKSLSHFQFLTAKPLLVIGNIGERQLDRAGEIEAALKKHCPEAGCRVIALCGKLEMELAQLSENAAAEFRAGFGIKEAGLERVIRESYDLLGLISFFTIASGEVRHWSVPRGTPAVKAAGKIHSDMERGFIRAEVISYEDLVRCGGIAEARHRGLLRLEGKIYPVEDGDVITFLFNV